MEVWLLENKYEDGSEYDELVLHVPRTNIWLINSGLSGEHLEDAHFTQLFWDRMDEEHLLTRLGSL